MKALILQENNSFGREAGGMSDREPKPSPAIRNSGGNDMSLAAYASVCVQFLKPCLLHMLHNIWELAGSICKIEQCCHLADILPWSVRGKSFPSAAGAHGMSSGILPQRPFGKHQNKSIYCLGLFELGMMCRRFCMHVLTLVHIENWLFDIAPCSGPSNIFYHSWRQSFQRRIGCKLDV
jgi:hypothetical protein